MIAWREKIRAMLLHFLVTLVMAAIAAAVIFLVWFPDPFQAMLGGVKFFLLISLCDLVLGPLISLVIYNSRKSRRELVTDYTVVGLVQIAALVYGVFILSGTRPVYITFVASTHANEAIIHPPMPLLPGSHLVENYTAVLTCTPEWVWPRS